MDKNSDNIVGRSVKDVFNRPARATVGVDVEKYKAFLNDPALTETQKEEILQALWSIVMAFVELGFGVHPLQEVCESGDEHSLEALNEAFDRAERRDSNEINKRNGGLRGSLEME